MMQAHAVAMRGGRAAGPTYATAWPNMTASNAPAGYAMTASSEASAGLEAWRAHDGVVASPNRWAAAAGDPGWLQATFPSLRKMASYTLTPYPSLAPASWTLEGSVNGTTGWTAVDSRSSQSFPGDAARTFTIAAPAAYLAYRLTLTTTAGGSPVLVEWTATFLAA
jgi:hypothetical protein